MRQIKNPDEFRDNICKNLNKIISDIKICKNIEKGLVNYSIKKANEINIVKKWDNEYFVLIYIDRLRTIMMNLENNEELLNSIINKKIKAHKISCLSHQDMQPEKWKTLIDNKKERDENLYSPKIDANTDNFTCRKCKSNRCSYYQLQTRSGDEPMTTFVSCIDCGNRWKC
jgi:transcription elongation factor S-II